MSTYNWVRHARHIRWILAEGVGAAFMTPVGRMRRRDVIMKFNQLLWVSNGRVGMPAEDVAAAFMTQLESLSNCVMNAAATPSARAFLACILCPGYLVKVRNYIPAGAMP